MIELNKNNVERRGKMRESCRVYTKVLLLLVLSCFLLFLYGCSKGEGKETINEPVGAETDNGEDIVEEPEVEEEVVTKVKSPLTGIYIVEEKINDRVIAVMLDNQYSARPQAGITQFDIVYEILAEGNITRYMGIIGTGQPENIGPVRSSRDYFIHRALEYDALYVHVGGSPQAYEAISELKVPSVDAMHQGGDVFWRKKHKSAPHNMYSSFEAIIKGAERKNYRAEGKYDLLKFSENETALQGEDLIYIEFPYNGKSYYSSYKFNEDEKVYYRYINGSVQKDENGDIPVTAKNIIVQFTKTRAIKGDTEGRLAVDMVGEGEGWYISNGKCQKLKWKKEDIYKLTKYYDESGEEIILNPGNIWIQVYPENRKDEIVMKSSLAN